MSDYQRFISYIYAYDGEIRVKNVGFAKMEARNGRCRIGINLKGAYVSSDKEEVYAVRRTERGLEKFRLGSISIRKGNGEFSYMSEDGKVGGGPYHLSDFSGLFIGGEDNSRFYFTGWDDAPVSARELLGWERLPQEEAQETENAEEKNAEIQTEEEVSAAEFPYRPVLSGAPAMEAAEELTPEAGEGQVKAEELVRPEKQEQELWPLLCKVYPKMLAAPGQEAWNMLEIQLQDIGRLPRRNWIYGNNSFLVQGFYRYGHLLLARREKDGEEIFWLGVPGTRDETEAVLARMFGFREYLPGNRRRKQNFGYWCTEVSLKD
jgi:hypothetical protein